MDLNTILIILGVIALIALVAHGLWANRREKSQYFENANIFTRDSRTQSNPVAQDSISQQTDANVPAFTQSKEATSSLTVAQGTVTQTASNTQSGVGGSSPAQQKLNFEQETTVQPIEPKSVDHIKITLPNDPAPVYQATTVVPESNSPSAQDITKVTIADIEANAGEEGVNTSSERLRVQLQEAAQNQPQSPYSSASKVSLQQPIEEVEFEPTAKAVSIDTAEPADETSTFIMLYVVAPENRVFQGAVLEQRLEALGFILGRDRIYHRHLDLNPGSPILFSVADINAPGTFEIYHLSEFSTVGIVLFMKLPSAGNDRANLKMMIRAAKTLAEQLDGFVLNDQQEIFTEQSEREYLAKVH
ncbi:MAG TPA: cell division protein ZipA [Pasteurellaceae bacterium]|nr:cell division protein ZipA [Pasteurellaceae bacterium]